MFAWLMLAALAIEAALGWPNWLDQRIGHPVRWFGWLVDLVERAANSQSLGRTLRIVLGGCVAVGLVALAAGVGWIITAFLPEGVLGFAIAALLSSTLIASRSLYEHVRAVYEAFDAQDLGPARHALSMIVGRRTEDLNEAQIASAAIESLAENTSDGVIAPLFWGALLGLPGLCAYKAINTLDSIIGHRNPRFEAFGKVAARLDDVANLIPARFTGLLFALCVGSMHAFRVMIRDARQHRSPNAGWPESAMAGALNVRLSGPRSYGEQMTDDAWLNHDARTPRMADLPIALALYRRSICVVAVLLAGIGWLVL